MLEKIGRENHVDFCTANESKVVAGGGMDVNSGRRQASCLRVEIDRDPALGVRVVDELAKPSAQIEKSVLLIDPPREDSLPENFPDDVLPRAVALIEPASIELLKLSAHRVG